MALKRDIEHGVAGTGRNCRPPIRVDQGSRFTSKARPMSGILICPHAISCRLRCIAKRSCLGAGLCRRLNYRSETAPPTSARPLPAPVLLGTVSPIMSEGTEAIRAYFMPLKGSGNKNEITERRTFVLSDSAVVVAGFYLFTRMVDGKPVPAPSRFTMLLTKRGSEWAIAHHHSSPHVQPKQ
jgi:hypothetical protein